MWVIAGPDRAPERLSVPARLIVLGTAVVIHPIMAQMLYAGLFVSVSACRSASKRLRELDNSNSASAHILNCMSDPPDLHQHIPRRVLKVKRLLTALTAILVASLPLSAVIAKAPDEKASPAEQRRYFTEDAIAPMIKPANYDVTIVEYMDYQCPYCRATHGPLKQLLAKDKKIRVIFRDWPIFGDASSAAALVAIASKYQGKYVAMHDALMETPLPLSPEKIKAAARTAGVDWERAQKDIDVHSKEIEDLLARNDEQAQLLGLSGTPGFIIGDVQSFGGMTLKQLQESVAAARNPTKTQPAKAK